MPINRYHFIVTLTLFGAVVILSILLNRKAYRVGYLEGQAKVYQDIATMPEDQGNCYGLQNELDALKKKQSKKHK
jgi:hypothetical protein